MKTKGVIQVRLEFDDAFLQTFKRVYGEKRLRDVAERVQQEIEAWKQEVKARAEQAEKADVWA